MKAIKSFFKKCWDFICSNAWIQPILFVAAIFICLLAIEGIGKASQDWSCSKKDTEYVKEILFEKLEEKIESDESFIVYIGHDGCAGCHSFQPVLKKFHKENKTTTIYYLNVGQTDSVYVDATIDTTDLTNMWKLIKPVVEGDNDPESIKNLTTPTIAAVKNGEFVKAYIGGGVNGISYSDVESLKEAIN